MSISLNPIEYGMKNDGRIVIYNVKKKQFFDRRQVKYNKPFIINDKVINNNIIDYKFKFQERINNEWIDVKNYFYLEKSIFIRQFWTNKVKMKDEDIKEIITYFCTADERKYYTILSEAMTRTVNYIVKGKEPNYKNILYYFELQKNMEIAVPELWENISIYFNELIEIKSEFKERKLPGVSFIKISEKLKKDDTFYNFIHKKALYLQSLKFQFSEVLAGLLYSLIEKRNEAFKCINKSLSYKNNYIVDFNLGLGLNTYIKSVEKIPFNNNIKTHYENNIQEREITFLIALDESFLRKYAMQMFYSIIALGKYSFHFHIVLESQEPDKLVNESLSIFNEMKRFYSSGSNDVSITFSTENVPSNFSDKTTYFACSRFLNASKFMDMFNSDIITLDADFVVTDDFRKMIVELRKHDIGVTITTGFSTLYPWTRFMGGTLYLKHNEKSRSFINHTKDYILSNSNKSNAWTLDQNALCYAYEEVKREYPDIKIGDLSTIPRPLTQPNIRRFIEN